MFEVIFVCFSPVVVFLPHEGEKTRLKAVPLCCTSPTPPGCSHRSTVATCSSSPLNVNTLNPSVSCVSHWQVFVSLGMSTRINIVWMSVFSVFATYIVIKLWDVMSGLDTKDSFQVTCLSLPSPLGTACDAVCCEDVTAAYIASLFKLFAHQKTLVTHQRRNILLRSKQIIHWFHQFNAESFPPVRIFDSLI